MNENLLRTIAIEAKVLKEFIYDRHALNEKIEFVANRLNYLLGELEKQLPEPPRGWGIWIYFLIVTELAILSMMT